MSDLYDLVKVEIEALIAEGKAAAADGLSWGEVWALLNRTYEAVVKIVEKLKASGPEKKALDSSERASSRSLLTRAPRLVVSARSTSARPLWYAFSASTRLRPPNGPVAAVVGVVVGGRFGSSMIGAGRFAAALPSGREG